jgi:hypothetical protein
MFSKIAIPAGQLTRERFSGFERLISFNVDFSIVLTSRRDSGGKRDRVDLNRTGSSAYDKYYRPSLIVVCDLLDELCRRWHSILVGSCRQRHQHSCSPTWGSQI